MQKKKNRTPHDSFFQLILEHKNNAKCFFKTSLSPQLAESIDWRTLTIADAVVRPEGKKALYTDITYHAYTLSPKGSVYLHAEQERNIDPDMPKRTDEYLTAINLKHIKQGHKKLPIVAQVVLYNGKRPNYPDPADLSLRFERPDLVPLAGNVALRPFILIDLSKREDADLAAQGPCGLMMLLLKHSDRKDFLSWMVENKGLLRRLTTAQRMIISIFDYVYSVRAEDTEQIVRTFAEVYPEQKKKIMSAKERDRKEAIEQGMQKGVQQGMQKGVQQGMQKGVQQGMQKGVQQEKFSIAKTMLHQLQLGLDVVKQATGLSDRQLSQLAKG